MSHGCKICQLPHRRSADFNCVFCCIGYLETLPDRSQVERTMTSIERIIGKEKMDMVRETYAQKIEIKA